MRSSRLLAILLQLQLRGRVGAPALAREFEVSVRTIYRDVDELSAAGVPVYAERGRAGGIALREGYRARLTAMSRGEARTVPLAGMGFAARDLGLGVEAAAAQLKLLASLPVEAGADAERVAARFHLDPLPWYHRAEALAGLPQLAAALWHDRRVRFAYSGWEGDVEREVSPLGLVLKGGLWYLVAASGAGKSKSRSAGVRPRTYRVSNITARTVLDQPARRPAQFDLAAWWPKSVTQFEARLMRTAAIVRISEEGLRILRAVSPAAAERVLATQRPCHRARRAGWVRAELPIESPAYSARQLLRLGSEVEVLAPPEVRKALLREARAVARLYAARPKATVPMR
jgi:predicted DNA-binding transcriptional regulator YafY